MDEIIDVYSYARISHPDQIFGRGLDRQDERLDAYMAARPDHRLVQRMQDIGISGWSGLHRSKGTFGAFEGLVDQGLIKPGSKLALDKLDRLTREDTDVALELLLKLIRVGIVIVTLADGMEYTNRLGRTKLFEGLLRALIAFEVASGESDKKSDNHLDNWKAKRKDLATNGTRLTRMGPGWLDPREPGDGECPPGLLENDRWRENEHAHTVRLAHERCAQGGGTGSIIKHMVSIKRPSPTEGKREGGGKWALSSMRRLLTDRAVIGEFKTDKVGLIEDYYPQTVSPDLWQRSQAAWLRRQESGVIREQQHVNIFAGLGFCACCAGPYGRGASTRPRLMERFVCRTKHATRQCTRAPSHSMAKTIRALHTALAGIFPVQRPGNSGLDTLVAQARLDIERAQTSVNALYDAFGAAPSPSAQSAIERAESRLDEARRTMAELDRRVVLERGEVSEPEMFTKMMSIIELAAMGDQQKREELAVHLRAVVHGVVFHADHEIVLLMRSGVTCGIRGGAGLWWRWPGGETNVNMHVGIKPGFALTDEHITRRTAEVRRFVPARLAARGKSAEQIKATLSELTPA